MTLLTTLFEVGFFAALIRISTPLLLATLGELYAERSGVLNLGIEGIMLLGAMVGFSAAYFTGSLWLGVAAALLTGMLAGLLMAFLAVVLGVSQHVSGIGTTLLATGLAFYLLPPDLRAADLAAEHRAVPAAADPAPLRHPCPRPDPLQPDAAHLHRAPRRAGDRLRCSTARRGASTCAPSARTRARPTPPASASGACARQALVIGGALMGLGRRLSHHLAVQRLHLRRRLRPRLGGDRARRLRPVEPVALRRRRAPLRRARGLAAPPAGDTTCCTCPIRCS